MCRAESIENYNKICSKYKEDFSKMGSLFCRCIKNVTKKDELDCGNIELRKNIMSHDKHRQ